MNCSLACARLLLSLSLLLALIPCQAKPPPATAPAPLNEADSYRFAFQYDPPRILYIIIQVSINGKPPLPFMLDTGTNTPVIIDTEAAKRLGLPISGPSGTVNGGRASFAWTTAVRSVLLPGVSPGRNINFTGDGASVADLALIREDFPGIKLAGILGVNLLDKFTIRLDFSRKILTLYVKPHPPLSIFGATVVPLVDRGGKHQYFIQVSPAKGLSADLPLDTGSPETSLPLTVANQIRSAPRYGVGTGLLGTYYISQALLLPKIQVGDSSLYNFSVDSSPDPGSSTLGLDLLSCFRVTLDFPHQQMFLELVAGRPYRLRGRVGIHIKPEGHDFRVKTVEDGSPAEAAGIQRDDKILSVDGCSLYGLSLDAASEVLSDFANTRATFLLQRGKSKPFTLSCVRLNRFTAPPNIVSGIVVEKPDKQPMSVIQVDAGFPAQKAGLVVGDTIIAVDGVPAQSMSADQTNDAFEEDKLTLTVQRAGESKPRVLVLAK